ncbi:MAG: hypothetical protein ABI559_00385 [Chloroflexota bacterium]
MSEDRPQQAVRFSGGRIVWFAILSFAIALAVHGVIILIGGGDSPFRLFVTPLIGAGVMFFGLRGFPAASRVRLSLMVGICLLLFSGAT